MRRMRRRRRRRRRRSLGGGPAAAVPAPVGGEFQGEGENRVKKIRGGRKYGGRGRGMERGYRYSAWNHDWDAFGHDFTVP
jgi:hypothetical protein